jgi:transposase-like protein
MEKEQFDFDAFKKNAIAKLRAGGKLSHKGVLEPLYKELLEAALLAEMDDHLDEDERQSGNRKNGKTSKTVKTGKGSFELQTPRDRSGTFEPKLVPKREVIITEELQQKVLRLYGKGMSTRDICDYIEEMYDYTLSPTTISNMTESVVEVVRTWQQRELESTYCFVWLDAMFYKVRHEGHVVSRALYNVLGVNSRGEKNLLGMYVMESEGARTWLQVLEDLKARGVQDILIACIDNLKGFAEAIEHTFPKTEVQLCVIQQIRNTMKYVSYRHNKEFMKELRTVYTATTKEAAWQNLLTLEDKWKNKYQIVFDSWKNNWERLSTYFQYPPEIRKMIYTTNIIEGFHRQVRKVTKTKGAFASDMALLKLVFMATENIVEKCTFTIGWAEIAGKLRIIFQERMPIELNN